MKACDTKPRPRPRPRARVPAGGFDPRLLEYEPRPACKSVHFSSASLSSHTSSRRDCPTCRPSLHGASTKLLQQSITADTCRTQCCSTSSPSSSTRSCVRCRAASEVTATSGRLEWCGSSSTSGRAATALTTVGRRRHWLKMRRSTSEESHCQNRLWRFDGLDDVEKKTAQFFTDNTLRRFF